MAVDTDKLAAAGSAAMSGASLAAKVPVPGSALVGAAVGFGASILMSNKMEKDAEKEAERVEKELAAQEQQAGQLAVRQDKEAQARSTMASATGRVIGGPVPDVLIDAAGSGTSYDAFKARTFPSG